MGSVLNRYPRDLAIRALTRVLSDRKTLEEALEETLVQGASSLAPGARGWLQEVCSGTLRWKGRLDLAIDSVALKKKPSGWLRKALLIGAYQLIAQDRSAAGAVVSETVDEVKRKEGEAPAKFANALLRRIAERASEWRELPAPDSSGSGSGDFAAWASLPDWLSKSLERDHGRAWLESYGRASLERPRLWLRARNADWKPLSGEAGPVAGSWRLEDAGKVTELPGFREGEFIVQDISSQVLVAEVVQAVGAKPGARALDLCAAPGGKSAGLAWSGFSVFASDREASRMALLESTIARVKADVKIVPKDRISSYGPFDLVWVDAPCSGSGILRRHPEVRWLRQERELEGLNRVQLELIREGWAQVKPGGWFAYSVCSVLKREGENVVQASGLASHRKKTWNLAPQAAPFGDGFWATLLQKLGAE